MSNKKAVVYVRLKEGVLDPQGVTIQKALAQMGYNDIASVRSGKFFEIELTGDGNAQQRVEEVCSKLLANPVIEQFRVEMVG